MKFIIPEIHRTPLVDLLIENLASEVSRLQAAVTSGVSEIQSINETLLDFVLEVQEDHAAYDRALLKDMTNSEVKDLPHFQVPATWLKRVETCVRRTTIKCYYALGKEAPTSLLRDRVHGLTSCLSPDATTKLIQRLKKAVHKIPAETTDEKGFTLTSMRRLCHGLEDGRFEREITAALNLAHDAENEEEFISRILYCKNAYVAFTETTETKATKARVIQLVALRRKRVKEIYDSIAKPLEDLTERSAFTPYEEVLLKIHAGLRACLSAQFLNAIGHPRMDGLLEDPTPEAVPLNFEKLVLHWQHEVSSLRSLAPELTPGIRQAIETMVTNASTFRRQNIPPDAACIRNPLAQIARVTIGSENAKERLYTLNILRTGSWDDIQVVLSEYLLRKTNSQSEVLRPHKILQETWAKTEPLKFIQELSFGFSTAAFKTAEFLATEVELQSLEEQEKARAEELRKATETQKILETFAQEAVLNKVDPPKPKQALCRFEYVENWGSANPRVIAFSVPPQEKDLSEKLRPILDGNHAIPIESIARAILHYVLETPAEIRQLMNKEFVGGQNWHKIKRSACRIYLRQENGVTSVHALHRKDWVKGCNLTTKF